MRDVAGHLWNNTYFFDSKSNLNSILFSVISKASLFGNISHVKIQTECVNEDFQLILYEFGATISTMYFFKRIKTQWTERMSYLGMSRFPTTILTEEMASMY